MRTNTNESKRVGRLIRPVGLRIGNAGERAPNRFMDCLTPNVGIRILSLPRAELPGGGCNCQWPHRRSARRRLIGQDIAYSLNNWTALTRYVPMAICRSIITAPNGRCGSSRWGEITGLFSEATTVAGLPLCCAASFLPANLSESIRLPGSAACSGASQSTPSGASKDCCRTAGLRFSASVVSAK